MPEPELSVLGIADLNPANVLWDGRTCRLVDFEDGGLSDPAYELADHTEHLAGSYDGDRPPLVEEVAQQPSRNRGQHAQHGRTSAGFETVAAQPPQPASVGNG